MGVYFQILPVKEAKPVPPQNIVLFCAPPAFQISDFLLPSVYYHLDMPVCCPPFKQEA